MSEYMKKKQPVQPAQAKKAEAVDPRREMTNGIPNSVLQDIFAGKRKADASMMGHSDTLAPSIAAKMSRAFGMDLSGVQVSRSDKMKGTGMQGMAQGNKVVLSSDVDLNTMEGQAVLGHELSHIRAQSQGIGMGHSGLYNNAALEHQADVEGMRAARGRPIYEQTMSGNPGMSYGLGMKGMEGFTPLSSNGISSTAGAPMQAKKPGDEREANQMAYNYAKGRAGKLKLDGMSPEELKNTKAKEDKAVMQYVRSLRIPKGKLNSMNAEVNERTEKITKDFGKPGEDTKQLMLRQLKDEYYSDLYDAAMGKKMKGYYSDTPKDASDEELAAKMENPYQNLDDAIGKKEEIAEDEPQLGLSKAQQLSFMHPENMKTSALLGNETKKKKSWLSYLKFW